MTRYYFDLRDGDVFIEDAEGLELADIAEAQIEAAEFLGPGGSLPCEMYLPRTARYGRIHTRARPFQLRPLSSWPSGGAEPTVPVQLAGPR